MRWKKRADTAIDAMEETVADVAQATSVAVPQNLDRATASLREGGRDFRAAMKRQELAGSGAVGAVAVGAMSTGALAVGALAIGALAVGAVAVGAFAIGRLSVRSARVDAADIDHLRIGTLELGEIVEPEAPAYRPWTRGGRA